MIVDYLKGRIALHKRAMEEKSHRPGDGIRRAVARAIHDELCDALEFVERGND